MSHTDQSPQGITTLKQERESDFGTGTNLGIHLGFTTFYLCDL